MHVVISVSDQGGVPSWPLPLQQAVVHGHEVVGLSIVVHRPVPRLHFYLVADFVVVESYGLIDELFNFNYFVCARVHPRSVCPEEFDVPGLDRLGVLKLDELVLLLQAVDAP